ncbi:MAG: protein kinase [Oscillospiraceae bacterium]|nr:protein kinase [Oscillospiraceae bacterium]
MQLNNNLCYGCMEQSSGEPVCPYCGYAADSPYLPAYLAPGVTLNSRYIVGKLLHYNGESALYIGYDTENDCKVLLREYMPDTLCRRVKDSSAVTVNQNAVAQYKTFMSEFVELNKTLARLRNLNHINPATDMFGDNNTGYVVFDYIEGQTLTDYLREHGGVLSWDQVKKMFPPIFTTLSLIHNAGLIHRGICPDNILITPKGELMITDFCVADERTLETELTPEIYSGYAAPEQYSTGKWQGTWTDVYGISALLYRILTGTVPVEASTRLQNDNLPEPMILNPDIPGAVSTVIMSGLALSGDMRIQTVTELVTGLFDQQADTHISQTQPIPIPPQHISDYEDEKGFGRNGTEAVRKKGLSRSAVFAIVGVVTVIVMFLLISMAMIFFEDSSSTLTNAITTSDTRSELDELAESLTHQTVSAETESTQPTLNEVEEEAAVSTTPAGSGSGALYVMNDLIGKNYETIKNSPTYDSLRFVPEYVYNEEISKGIILEQSLEKGASYYEGTEVQVVVSKGSQYATIPGYTGLIAKDYYALLNGKGIKFEEVLYKTEKFEDGFVCGISAEEGEVLDLEKGETIVVYVAVNPVEETTETEEEDFIDDPDYVNIYDDEAAVEVTDE